MRDLRIQLRQAIVHISVEINGRNVRAFSRAQRIVLTIEIDRPEGRSLTARLAALCGISQ